MKAPASAVRVDLHPLLVVGLLLSSAAHGLSDSLKVEERILRVEQGLLPPVSVRGQPVQTMSMTEGLKLFHVPGVSMAVINKGKIEWARGYGVVEAGGDKPVNTETLFQAASISKPVTAMAALALVERGKLALDEDVNSKLVSWKVPENDFTKEEKVTLRRLLSHSAGLTVHGFPGYPTGEPIPTLRAVLDGAKPANTKAILPDITPGSSLRYSGGGYCVVQQLLMDVTGKPFPLVLQKMVLEPLGMNHSSYEQPLPSAKCGLAAVGHTSTGEPIKGKWHIYPEMAAAGLWTTPSDLARFAIELQKCRIGKSQRVVSTRMARQMLTTQIGDCGLGIFLSGSGQTWRFSHGGGNEGFRSTLVTYAEDGCGAVVMANSDSGVDLNDAILRSVAKEYGWHDYRPKVQSVATLDPKVYAPYLGRYQISPGLLVAVTSDEGKLFAQGTNQPKVQLYPVSKTRFFVTEADVEMTFLPDDKGEVSEVVVNANGQEVKAKRVRQQ
jgi:CubicO group peptidase (beta-lactamase class C family)